MGRRAGGSIVTYDGARDTSFAARFVAYGERRHVTLGKVSDGWTRDKAQEELANILADVRRGRWIPPLPSPEATASADPTFHEFASEWFEAKRRELRPNTVSAYRFELSHHLLPFFGSYRLSEITPRLVDHYKAAKLRESELGGRIGAEYINKQLTRLTQIMETATEYDLIERNPAAGKRRRLKVQRPERTFLDRAEHIAGLLDAAAELDRKARGRDSRNRHALLATLIFAGLRISEALCLRWRDLDLADGRIRVGDSKTAAGVRWVDLLPVLRDVLLALRAEHIDVGSDALVFATASGGQQNPSNVRNRLLAKACEKANETLEEAKEMPLPHLTPHAMRRTFASILVALGRDPRYVMTQLGHADPKFTLKIYAQTMAFGDDQRARLEALVNGELLRLPDENRGRKGRNGLGAGPRKKSPQANESGIPL
ncbi:MAG: site-specific integrase [Thermoleophilaceae bacterium]|nr:site-specific integrase [Thermoleophilaceae bacterium]